MAGTMRGWIAPQLKQIQTKGLLTISFGQSSYSRYTEGDYYSEWSIEELKAIITKPSSKQLIYTAEIIIGTRYTDTLFSVDLDEDGEYKIEFVLKHKQYVSGAWSNNFNERATGYFFVVAKNPASSFYTIKDVIDRVLSVTPTRTAKGKNKYTFRNNAWEYRNIEAPEFTFTGKHLFEVMYDIASYQKSFPGLYKKEIYFRPLWNGIALTEEDLPACLKAVQCSAIDQYCTTLDSYVENMVCVNDTNVGTVVEPYYGGYISPRSDNGSAISETTAVIPTQSPIYQSLLLDMGEVDGETVGNIQSYVYEQEDYDSLSDTSSAYPYSKAYALKYTRFAKNYTELGHRISKGNALSDALTYPALANITKAKCGETVGTNLKTYLSSFIGTDNAAPFADLLFQPKYIPVVNARVRQYKPMMDDSYDATLFYNQQAELVDSEAFGEHVKALIQKLGNHTEIRVYRFNRIDDVPTVGTMVGDKIVYDTAMTIFETHVDVTLCLVDYAELSTYVGVKNEIKTSDISTTKWCNRFINFEEFLVFSHQAEVGDAISITVECLGDIVKFTESNALTCAAMANYTEDGTLISETFSPIKHLALGNSIYFQWEMLDNFAVGYKSDVAPSGATDSWTGTQYDRAQRAVRYCDMYGRTETVDFQLLKSGPTPSNSVWVVPENEIVWSVDEENDLIKFTLRNTYSCYVIVWFKGPLVGSDTALIFAPGETVKSTTWGNAAEETEYLGASLYDGYMSSDTEQAKISALRDNFMRTQIAHAYPQKSANLKFYPMQHEETKPRFQAYDLLVKKNSAEALKYATQYHFRQTWRDFIIGSGMSNFCSLVGGSCSQLQLFVSGRKLNRFERHFSLSSVDGFKLLEELPTFTVDRDNFHVKIELPSTINDSVYDRSWGLAGKDRSGNWQLIFGENKNTQNEAFLTTIYLIAKAKNTGEPRANATYMLSVEEGDTHQNIGYSVYANGEFYGQSGDFELPRGADVTIYNQTASSIYVRIDGIDHYVKYQGSYSFVLSKNMTYAIWARNSSGGDYSESM